jgi:hypothetical protein
MNQGEKLEITIKDTASGVINRINDQTSGQSGFMVASAHNGGSRAWIPIPARGRCFISTSEQSQAPLNS